MESRMMRDPMGGRTQDDMHEGREDAQEQAMRRNTGTEAKLLDLHLEH